MFSATEEITILIENFDLLLFVLFFIITFVYLFVGFISVLISPDDSKLFRDELDHSKTKIYKIKKKDRDKASLMLVGFLQDGYAMLLGMASIEKTPIGVTKTAFIANLGRETEYTEVMEEIYPAFFEENEEDFRDAIPLRPGFDMLTWEPQHECRNEIEYVAETQIQSAAEVQEATPPQESSVCPPITDRPIHEKQAIAPRESNDHTPETDQSIHEQQAIAPREASHCSPETERPLHVKLGCHAYPELPKVWIGCFAACMLWKVIKSG